MDSIIQINKSLSAGLEHNYTNVSAPVQTQQIKLYVTSSED